MYQKERTFEVFNSSKIDTTKVNYIHILGSGFSLDDSLYASQNLGLTAIGRLSEGIRIYHEFPNIKLVTSGYSKYNMQTQAYVAKLAAIELGVDAENVFMLEEPSTTSEEVSAFIKRFGTDVNLIVASDAIHLPRAIKMYKDAGIEAIAAPTNFVVKVDINNPIRFEFPNSRSFEITNQYFVAVIKESYYSFTGK